MRNLHPGISSWFSERERRAGFTLLELVLALGVTTMLITTLAGLTMAVQSAWNVSTNIQKLNFQSRAGMERIRWMVGQAGTYSINGGPVRLGLSLVTRTVSSTVLPETLVVWTGGRSGGIQDQRQPALSLPKVNELVIYTADPTTPNLFVEIQVAGNSSTIDFSDSGFGTTIQNLVSNSASSDRLVLIDALRTCRLAQGGALLGNVRFEVLQQPSDESISSTTVGTDAWYGLPWCQGLGSQRGGMRQATVRIELQLEADSKNVTVGTTSPTAIPILGCAKVRYAYRA